MVKNEDREEKWDMCVGEKKLRRRKKKENEDRKEKSGYAGGGENTKREKRKKKKTFWVGLNSFQITKILINFKTKIH